MRPKHTLYDMEDHKVSPLWAIVMHVVRYGLLSPGDAGRMRTASVIPPTSDSPVQMRGVHTRLIWSQKPPMPTRLLCNPIGDAPLVYGPPPHADGMGEMALQKSLS